MERSARTRLSWTRGVQEAAWVGIAAWTGIGQGCPGLVCETFDSHEMPPEAVAHLAHRTR